MSELDAVTLLLQQRQRELDDRLQRIRADHQRAAGPLSSDFGEQAVEVENDQVLERLEATTAADLAQVDHALQRLGQGLYGVCEHCGGAISAQRLQAVPQATNCSACAAR